MSRSYQFIDVPLAYLITFRGHGTWLHGDKCGSVDRFHNRYGSPRIPYNEKWREHNRQELKHPPVKLSSKQRKLVEAGIRETCQIRGWSLWTLNVRTNHVHVVVSARCVPQMVLTAFKANATRKLREAGHWRYGGSPWAERGSKKYLWTDEEVISAVVYVQYDQGEPLP